MNGSVLLCCSYNNRNQYEVILAKMMKILLPIVDGQMWYSDLTAGSPFPESQGGSSKRTGKACWKLQWSKASKTEFSLFGSYTCLLWWWWWMLESHHPASFVCCSVNKVPLFSAPSPRQKRHLLQDQQFSLCEVKDFLLKKNKNKNTIK